MTVHAFENPNEMKLKTKHHLLNGETIIRDVVVTNNVIKYST